MASSCSRRGLGWILGKVFSQKVWSGFGRGIQGSGGVLASGSVQWQLGARVGGEHDDSGLVNSLILEDIFQP